MRQHKRRPRRRVPCWHRMGIQKSSSREPLQCCENPCGSLFTTIRAGVYPHWMQNQAGLRTSQEQLFTYQDLGEATEIQGVINQQFTTYKTLREGTGGKTTNKQKTNSYLPGFEGRGQVNRTTANHLPSLAKRDRGNRGGKRGESEERRPLGTEQRQGGRITDDPGGGGPWDQHFISWRIWGRITVSVCAQQQYSYSICRTVKPAFHRADPGMFKRKVPRQAP